MLAKIKEQVMKNSRAKKLNHFYSLCSTGRVLDAGVSGKARVPGENIFLETFRFDGANYVGLGVEDLTELARVHPDKKFVTYDGRKFPFDDNEFDWVFSNAVIEHVGGRDEQILFLNEMLRVSKNVFFTTPNRYFPIESHTNVLLLHWTNGDAFFGWCQRHHPYWTRQNLQLLGRKDLVDIVSASNAIESTVLSNSMFGWPMTYTVVCRK